MTNSLNDIKLISQPYIKQTRDFLYQNGLSDLLKVDHLCVKCGSSEEYDHIRKLIESAETAQFSYQATITGRRIAYCKITDGIPFGDTYIHFIELSDHKKSEYFAGIHHIELYPATGTLQQLIPVLTSKGIQGDLKVRPHHTSFDVSLPSGFIIRLSDEPLIRKISQEILED